MGRKFRISGKEESTPGPTRPSVAYQPEDGPGRPVSSASVSWHDRITVDPAILVGKPVIKGTRLTVEFVIELLARGWAEAEILKNYPGVAHEDILACLAYASELLRSERVYPVPSS